MISAGEKVEGKVRQVLQRAGEDQPSGLLVDIGFTAFIPCSLILAEQRDDLDSLVGKWMEGVVHEVDKSLRVIVQPESFSEYVPPKPDATSISEAYLQVLLANLRETVPPDDHDRYLGRENAKSILVALTNEDCGFDADQWEHLIRNRPV